MLDLPGELAGFVFCSPIDSDMLVAKAAVDAKVANGVKLVTSRATRGVSKVNDTSDLENNNFYTEVATYRRYRNHRKNMTDNMGRRLLPNFYMGEVTPEIAEILKKYKIPVLDVNREKYPIKENEQSQEIVR